MSKTKHEEQAPAAWTKWTPSPADMAELYRWRRSQADIPSRFIEARVRDFSGGSDLAAARKSVERYIRLFQDMRKDGTCLVFLGGVGTGKTTLACAVAGELAESGWSTKYRKLSEAVAAVRDTYRRDSVRGSSEVIAEMIEPDLLVLDEVGVQHGTQDETVIISRILDGRYEALKPTLVVSNLDKEGLKQSLGERCVDRLRDKGGVFLTFTWKSLRGR